LVKSYYVVWQFRSTTSEGCVNYSNRH